MAYAIAAPDVLVAAARDLAAVGSAISVATGSAAVATRQLLPAAADEVSTEIAALFAGYADEYRALSAQAAAFHEAFVGTLQTGAASYLSAEAVNAGFMQAVNSVNASTVAAVGQPLVSTNIGSTGTALIMGGTFNPQPTPGYVAAINSLYIQSNPNYTGFNPFGLYTPETVAPFYGATTLNQSIAQGQFILNNAIMGMPAGSHTLVFSYSQSSVISTLEIRALDALPPAARPSPSDLSFMLIGNGDNPNGGVFSRFSFNIPILDITTAGATPSDTPYPTTIYTLQYDGLANFPQYPLDVVADLNAVAGAALVHSQYSFLTAAQLQSAVPLATSPGYYENGGVTHYYVIPNQNLPLLDPVRAIPFVGTPLADLLQPDLRVLVNLGYNSNGYADVTAPAQLFPGFSPVDDLLNLIPPPYNELIAQPGYPPMPLPDLNPVTIAGQLVLGAQQGVGDAFVDLGLLPPSYYATTYPAVNVLAEMVAVAE
ncbi:MAG: PE-PPE domain-containing protein [Mycobacterium sp.]